jgi:hypothetical protein
MVGTHVELMIITVPRGIIFVSSAIGISEAPKKGLRSKHYLRREVNLCERELSIPDRGFLLWTKTRTYGGGKWLKR